MFALRACLILSLACFVLSSSELEGAAYVIDASYVYDPCPEGYALIGWDACQKIPKKETEECEWNVDEYVCEPKLSTMAESLSKSEDAYSQLLSRIAICELMNASECLTSGTAGCVYDVIHDRCFFPYFLSSNEDSSCYKNAPGVVGQFQYGPICPTFRDEKTCGLVHQCVWDENYRRCKSDALMLFFGFSDLVYDRARKHVEAELTQDFHRTFDTSLPGFDASDILEWDAPYISCPFDIPKPVCEGANAHESIVVPAELYCSLKGNSSFNSQSCADDPQCTYDAATNVCTPSLEPLITAFWDSILAIVPSTKHETDQTYWNTYYSCSQITNSSDCQRKDECTWKGFDCTISDEYIIRLVLKHQEDDYDPVCFYLGAMADSGCVDYDFECTWLDECAVQANKECAPTASFLISDGSQRDPSVEGEVHGPRTMCSEYHDGKSCQEARSDDRMEKPVELGAEASGPS